MVMGLICTCELYKVCSHLQRTDMEIYQGHQSLFFALQHKGELGSGGERQEGEKEESACHAVLVSL